MHGVFLRRFAKMKVLHVISDENIGGAGVLLTTLLETMDRSRVESVVAMPMGSLLCDRVKASGIPVIPLQNPCDRFSWKSVRELEQIIDRAEPEIVHANAAICARVAGRLRRRIVVHTRHCCFTPSRIYQSKLVQRTVGWLDRILSDRVIATADAAAENLYAMGIRPSSVEIIVNGVVPVRSVSEVELQDFRKKWGIDKDDFCVGICARLEEYKGHDIFLKAIQLILDQKSRRSIRFLIVGDGSMRETLEQTSRKLGIEEHVVFTGFLSDMAPIYRLLDLNVNCSRGTETSCLALSEGMSASLPFLATDFGGNVAMQGGSDAGILFPIDDARTLAALILCVEGDRALHAKMCKAARARYEKNYTAVRMAEHLTAVYEDLMRIKGAKRALQR